MLKCPVCAADNDDYALTCISCKGYLQNRVPNLDFFDTAWKVLESPRAAFRRITLAEHKNYAFALFAQLGISLAFATLLLYRLGDRFESLVKLLVFAISLGAAAGIAIAPIAVVMHLASTWALGGRVSFRNSLGVLSYALVPVLLSLVFILPIELMTFGMYLFTANPHPLTIKPVSYIMLTGFDAVLAAWTLALVVVGTRVAQGLSLFRSACCAGIVGAGVIGTVWIVTSEIVKRL